MISEGVLVSVTIILLGIAAILLGAYQGLKWKRYKDKDEIPLSEIDGRVGETVVTSGTVKPHNTTLETPATESEAVAYRHRVEIDRGMNQNTLSRILRALSSRLLMKNLLFL